MKKLNLKPLLSGFAGGLLAVCLLALMGAQPSVYSWARATFLIKGGPPVTADATARNIVATTTTGQVPLNVQQRTGAGTDAFKVYANGSYRLRIDSNGAAFLQGAQAWKWDTLAPGATPLSGSTAQIPVTRYAVTVNDATTANRHIQLQAANAVGAGHAVLVIDAAGTAATGNITINRAVGSSDTITTTTTGHTSCTITTNGGAALFISDGTSVWKRILLAG